jgi:hypothetical protein
MINGFDDSIWVSEFLQAFEGYICLLNEIVQDADDPFIATP